MNTDPLMSATYCGCDPGCNNYVCERHRMTLELMTLKGISVVTDPTIPYDMIGIRFHPPTRCTTLPTDPKARKTYPIATGFFDYFPDAIAAIAHVSWVGNEQHNPGTALHWDRSKSTDEADTMLRHFSERGTLDTDGCRHTAKAAWRLLAILQKEIEEERAIG